MDLHTGFTLDDPPIQVPWTVSVAELRHLLGPHGLREVTTGYHVISCQSLGGLHHELGFHFMPRASDRLDELEFFRATYLDPQASFEEFQRHLEATFGPPHGSGPETDGPPRHQWHVPGAEILHYVIDRFGSEEHVRIRRRNG